MKTIDLQAPTQLRVLGESMHHVRELAYIYADIGAFQNKPLVAAIKGSDKLVPIDGFHRLRAIEWLASDLFKDEEDAPDVSHLDLEVVDVDYVEYDTIGEAVIAAAGVNGSHGLKRQQNDIKSAINAILDAEKMMFMHNRYQLNKKAIMKAVNCSSRTYERQTSILRGRLKSTRDMDILKFDVDGHSQREIADIVCCDQATVQRILAAAKTSVTQMHQPEESEVEGVAKTHDAQMQQSEDEESTSVFTHCTSVTPVENPWETKESVAKKPKVKMQQVESPALGVISNDDEASSSIVTMFSLLSPAKKNDLLLILSDLALEF